MILTRLTPSVRDDMPINSNNITIIMAINNNKNIIININNMMKLKDSLKSANSYVVNALYY